MTLRAPWRIELHHIVRVVVGEQHRAFVAGDDAVGVVALPRPDGFPRLAGGDDAGNGRGRGRQRIGGQRRPARRGRDRNAEGRGRGLALRQYRCQSRILPGLLAVAAGELDEGL